MNYSKMYTALTKVLDKKESISFAMTDITSKYIEIWSEMFKDHKDSMNLPSTIASEHARLITLEMNAKVEGSVRASYINDHYQKQIKKARLFTEYACAKGGVILKPYATDQGLATQIVQADSFFPISFDDSENLTRVIFIEQFKDANAIFTRVEYHSLEGTKLTITNKAYKAMNDGILGNEVALESVPRWQGLAESLTVEGVAKLPIGYFRIPIANNKDSESCVGISVYSRAQDLIQEADRRYQQINWEFESKETAIHIAESLLGRNPQTGNLEYPQGKKRLYRTIEYSSGATDKPLIDSFSPDIRDSSFFNGLNQQLRRIEFACHLAYGTLSDPNNTDKTAEEIKSSKQRSYTFVNDCQMALQKALEDYIDACNLWCTIYGLVPEGACNPSFVWDDSLVVDTEKERQTDRNDVAMGAMQLWEYRMKWYGETEEQAKAAVEQSSDEGLIDDVDADPIPSGGGSTSARNYT